LVGNSEALLSQTELGSTDLGCPSLKGSSYSPLGVLSWNGGLCFTPPTSSQRNNLEAQSPFRGQQITQTSAPEEIYVAPANEGMMSTARNYVSKQPEILNVTETDIVESMGILPGLFSCFFNYCYVIVFF
jgi:hypothetical protein